MLELIFQGFLEWAYGLALECWQYFSTALLDIMSMDFAYLKSHAPVVDEIMQILLAVGWALLIGNLVFQALKSMAVGLGFEGEDPKLLFARTFVFAFLLLASPQICEIGLSMTSKIIELLQIPDAVNVTFVDESVFGAIGAAWLLVIIFGIIVMFKVFKLLLEIAERYVILAMLTITAPLAFAMGGSKSTSEIFTGWCRMFGSMCLLMVTNVIFCSCHSSQRFRCSPVDRADPYDCQGRTESRRHCNTHRLKSRYHRRLSGEGTPRHADLYGGSQCGFSNYKGSGQVRRKRRQRRCAQRAVRRPPHGRAQRRSWQHGGVCPAKRSAAKQHKSKHITTVVCCAKRLSTYRRAAITLAGKVRPICCAGQYA